MNEQFSGRGKNTDKTQTTEYYVSIFAILNLADKDCNWVASLRVSSEIQFLRPITINSLAN